MFNQSPFPKKTLAFYAKPLIGKWRKTFKKPTVLFVSPWKPDAGFWKKTLKAASFIWWDAQHLATPPKDLAQPVDLVFLLSQAPDSTVLDTLNPWLKKGGAWIWVLPNPKKNWSALQTHWEKLGMADTYPVGFHPQGAVAWWPFFKRFMGLPGILIEWLLCFFPGRYQLALRWGKYWMVRALKRDDFTAL